MKHHWGGGAYIAGGKLNGPPLTYYEPVRVGDVVDSVTLPFSGPLSSSSRLSRLFSAGSRLPAAESVAVDVAGGSARLRYMGSTPDKFSRTGREVVDRMRSDGLIVGEGPLVRGNPNNLQLVTEGGQLVRIDSAVDMAHTVDAVTWWNSTGRFYGAKSPEVRQFMLDSKHYILQPSGPNRSAGAGLRQTYQPPVPPTFGTLKR